VDVYVLVVPVTSVFAVSAELSGVEVVSGVVPVVVFALLSDAGAGVGARSAAGVAVLSAGWPVAVFEESVAGAIAVSALAEAGYAATISAATRTNEVRWASDFNFWIIRIFSYIT
jgi:hypothetical protein